jgi:dipeptidyl aminopeptidase/acylaminoacyl peptidase
MECAKIRIALLLLVCAGLSVMLRGQEESQEAASSAAMGKWQVQDVIMAESAALFRISPDGKWAVWVKSTSDKEKDVRVSNLFLSSLTEEKEIQLTRGSDDCSRPRWSPSGDMIAFLSTRALPKAKEDAPKSQLWLIHPFGGEPWNAVQLDRGVRSFEWLDKDTILFSAEEDPSLYEQKLKEKKDDTRAIDDLAHTPYVRLFKLAVADKKITRLTQNNDWIETWAVSRDGRHAVAAHAQYLSYEWDQRIPPKIFLHDLQNGEAREVFPGGKIRPQEFLWARDNSGFYAVVPYTTHPDYYTATIQVLYFYDLAAGTATQVDLGWDNGLGYGIEACNDGFIALLAAGARFQPARYVRNGTSWSRTLIEGEHAANIYDFTLSEDGKTLLYDYSSASRPSQWYRATLDGSRIDATTQLTKLNPQFKSKTVSRTEVIRWQGSLDEPVEGILYYPHHYEEGKKYPLVVAIHGGPAGADFDAWDESWAYPINLITQREAFVLRPNYHGSGNYGLSFVESICCGKYYDLEIPDIEKGIDHLIQLGLADPEQIGTMGWSNGSILSIQLTVTNPTRFKVASVGAGDVEWISDWANVDFGESFDAYYFGKSPLQDPELYLRKSPFFKMDQVQTPTLIFFGTEDRNVPTDQGWSHYRALYYYQKAPVRFLLFPGEPHSLRKLSHQARKVEEELAWLDRYLFKAGTASDEALKDGSPLGIALKKHSYPQVDGSYGVSFKDGSGNTVLIPEVVQRGILEIGRFEVTRAQYAAFDKSYRLATGQQNFPVNGISLDQAKSYVAWLRRITGQTYRLPNADEVEELYKPREGENTLDYWAGYHVNPEDAERLTARVRELGSADSLLKPVGSFQPDGSAEEELIFDLGGNVAEWVLNPDGSGRLAGGCAVQPADAKAQAHRVESPYTGFRVLRGR